MFSLNGKIAVVTGGTGVLGGVMAKGLAAAGARVAVMGRNEANAQKVVNDITQAGGLAMALPADVNDRTGLEAALQKLTAAWGAPDILVNGAGGNQPGATIMPDKSFFHLSMDDFKKVTELNLYGTVLPTLVFGEAMAGKKSGVVINISSMAADRALTRVVGYGASKAAVDNLTKWLAVEFAQKYGEGMRVNAIAPGFFIGEQNRRLLTNEDGSLTPRGHTIIGCTPMGRFGEAEELVGTLIWLCSDASKFVTGIVVPVDGGFSAFSGV